MFVTRDQVAWFPMRFPSEIAFGELFAVSRRGGAPRSLPPGAERDRLLRGSGRQDATDSYSLWVDGDGGGLWRASLKKGTPEHLLSDTIGAVSIERIEGNLVLWSDYLRVRQRSRGRALVHAPVDAGEIR
jgi:hypothetical protein